MVLSRTLLAVSAILSLAVAHAPQQLGKRAPFKAVGIEKNKEGFGSEPLAANEFQAGFAPEASLGKKNASMPQLKDRSMELYERQSCDAGYWYCSAFGRCCPRTSNCCSYGYCIDPEDTCCPDGPCDPGWNCCGPNCSPPDGDCCSNGRYCEAGNMCVRLGSTGSIVCCTDLQCTAVVESGSTSYVSTTQRPDPTSVNVPSITAPPERTTVVGGSYETWYWTVTWWYLSFYWSSFRAESTVTYTRIYETTTYTTTATDRSEASSLFSDLSESLSFTPPPDAQTSLASLLNAEPSETGFDSISFENPFSTLSIPSLDATESTTTASPSVTAGDSTQLPPSGGGGSSASSIVAPLILAGVGAVSGILMIML